jgi:hypothetical protein
MHTLSRTLLPLLALSACVIETEPRQVPGTDEPVPRTTVPRTPAPPTPEVCQNDAEEPNDAIPVEASGLFENLVLSTDDIDRFVVTLAPGDNVWADAWFSNADGNLDLYLTDVDGEVLAWSATDTDGETTDYTHEGTGLLDVVIETNLYMAPPDTCMGYGLEIVVTPAEDPATPPPATPPPATPPPPPVTPPPPVCVDDASEPNNTWTDATELLPTVDGITLFDFVADDTDTMYLDIQPDEDVRIIVHHDTPGVSLDVALFDADGPLSSGIGVAGADLVFDLPATPTGGVVDLEIIPFQADACAPYIVEVESTLLICEEDVFEPNDVNPVAAVPPLDVTLFPGDVDRFAIDLLPGEELFVDAFFDDTWGNVDLELFDLNGVALDWSTSDTDDEQLYFFNDGVFTEQLTVEVTLFDPLPYTCQDATLDWVIYGPACVDDVFEGANDTVAGATELVPQPAQSVFYDMIADDDDWFWIQTAAGEAVDVFIVHDTPGAELDLTVFDALGQLDYTSTNLAGVEVGLSLPVTFPGDIYDLQVRPLSGALTCLPYTMTVVTY